MISTTGSPCIATGNKAVLLIGGFKFITATAGYALQASGDSLISVTGSVEFGTVAAGSNHIGAFSSIVSIGADYTISGDAAVHAYAADGGIINDYMRTITLTGTPAFSTAFAQAERCAVILVFGNTFSGAATGARYNVNNNAVLVSGGTTLPGSSAGSTSSGGQYS